MTNEQSRYRLRGTHFGNYGRQVKRAARSPLGIISVAVFGPLLAVGAVGAATGDSPVDGPVEIVEAVATSVGIGGNSGEVRMDAEHRAEASQDWGQPGSWPGNTANAPGLNRGTGDDDGEDSTVSAAEVDETPTPNDGTPTPDDGDVADAKAKPHENGKGCDDVLFAMGEPPFASPGGPVGCEVGNSGEHRKNGAKATETPVPDDGAEDEPTPDAAEEEDDTNGGVSRGLGKGHDEEKPGNGNGYGHDKHDHDPNPNGRGPGGSDDGGEETPTTAAAPAESTPVPGGPGGNGNGRGNGRNK